MPPAAAARSRGAPGAQQQQHRRASSVAVRLTTTAVCCRPRAAAVLSSSTRRPPALLRGIGGPALLSPSRQRCSSTAAAAAAAAATTATAAAATSSPAAAAAAVALGYAVVAGSLVRSVPQIVKVVRARSAEGLSLVSVAVELLCYTVTIAYNASRGYPLNTYGEVAACWLQDVALVLLVLRYGADPRAAVARAPRRAAAAAVAFCLLVAWLLSPACPADVLAGLQAANVAVLALGSRVPQIVLNVRRGDAGLLSATSCALNVAGNAARAFTTLVLTKDALLLAGALTQGALNGVLLWQAMATRRARKLAAAGGNGGAVEATGAAAAGRAAAATAEEEEVEEERDAQQQQQQGLGVVLPATGSGGPATVYAA